MRRFKATKCGEDYYNDCSRRFVDISRLGLAPAHGLEEIAVAIVSEKTGVMPSKLYDVMVYNGVQLCFCYEKEMFDASRSKKWLQSYFSVTSTGQVVVCVDPDGKNEYFVIESKCI